MQNSKTPAVTAQTRRTFARAWLRLSGGALSPTTQTREQAPSSVSPTTYSACARYNSGTGGSATCENSIDAVSSESSTSPFWYFQ
ncbi:hypothetical protein EJB05_40512, partial [Eragrostis curvula]